jgi:hypothetical protein
MASNELAYVKPAIAPIATTQIIKITHHFSDLV